MSGPLFSLSAAQNKELTKTRNRFRELLGSENYLNSVSLWIPQLQRTMTKHKCESPITAVPFALREIKAPCKLTKYLLVCAAFELTQAAA